jgi:hypothetical protein
MNYLVDPQTLLFNSHRVKGFTELIKDTKIAHWDLLELATEVAEEWTDMWDEDQGFGSSDMTYMIQQFIDRVIDFVGKDGYLMTDFTPSLSVVTYSEYSHHERVQRMESGI